MLALTGFAAAAIAIPVTPVVARAGTCDARLITIVILGKCENNGPGTVIAQQQQQQAAGGGGGGGAAASSGSSSSGGSSSGGSPRRGSTAPAAITPSDARLASNDRTPTLARGMTPNRPAVRRLQGLLRGAGLNDVPLNGRYDAATRKAVRRFQRKHSIPTDRRTTVGPTTWALLERVNRR